MERRSFLSFVSSAVISASTVMREGNSAMGLEFEVTGVPQKKPSEVESVTIQFEKLQLTPSYIDESEAVEITVTLELDSYKSTQRTDTVKIKNGESNPVQSDNINPITIDDLSIPTDESVLQGTLKIKLEHPDITETYNQEFAITAAEFIEAEGGTTVTDETIDGQKYRIHAFESTGSGSFKINKSPSNSSIDVLLVAGGGGGGENDGGGGGAGGLIYRSNLAVSEGTYSLNIGNGGQGAPEGSSGFGESGEDTTGFGLTAIGGGGAAPQRKTARDGGSGGGAGHADSTGGEALQPSSPGGFGSDGGQGENGTNPPYPGGGGGGASERGKSPGTPSERGDGGDGKDYSDEFTQQFGDNGLFAGGGGGGTQSSPTSTGGAGGGGDGGHADGNSNVTNPESGQPNTGGGGGGTGEGGNQDAGNGGSGIILIRYPIS